ncbi:hypothetical protein ACIBQ1_27635 [Nonomuraea sp. NPDC050153]|uniref:hypothetical protein n=1 Tax=Nonomuraea sp. NPDC050153 TaxID=3364359 RepID=UPI0037B8B751
MRHPSRVVDQAQRGGERRTGVAGVGPCAGSSTPRAAPAAPATVGSVARTVAEAARAYVKAIKGAQPGQVYRAGY